jgi:putative membrane protein
MDLDYIFAGMLLAVGLRAAIFTSVFGARFERSIPVSFLQPVIFFFAFVPFADFDVVRASQLGIAFGVVIYLIGIFWVFIADRAGRPMIKSTFKLLQAFIAAWTENDTAKMEEFTEARAQEEQVETKIIKFSCTDSQSAIILPDVHPGPLAASGAATSHTFCMKSLQRARSLFTASRTIR